MSDSSISASSIPPRKMTTRVVKKDLVKSIPLELTKLDFKTVGHRNAVAAYQMNKPSDLPLVYQPLTRNRPKVHLDIIESHDLPQASIMNLNHCNILRVEAIIEIEKSASGQKRFAIFVEPHDGPLLSFLIKLDLAEHVTQAVPSQSLRNIASQLVDIVEVLWANGLYHGDLSIHNVYYSKAGGGITVKLVNFRKRDIDLASAQLLDWVGLGSILRSISDAAKRRNNNLSCLIIDDLAAELESLTNTALLPILKKRTLNHMFFWDTRRRTNFFIHKIPEALNDLMFVQRVRAHTWNLPWNNNSHGGLIDAMNEYRRDVLDITEYDGNDPLDNVKCMSGAYTHQEKLEEKIVDDKGDPVSVDVAVQTNQPMLCLTLYRLLPGENLAEQGVEE